MKRRSDAIKKRLFKKHSLPKRASGERIVFTIVFIIFLLYSISLILPLLWMLMNSFKSHTEFVMDQANGTTLNFPDIWHFSNYIDAFKQINYRGITFPIMFLNSCYYVFVGCGVSVFFQAATGYVISKYKFKAGGVIYAISIFCMTLPITGNMAAEIQVRAQLGLLDNLLAVIFTNMSSFGFNFLMMYAFYKGVSWTYAEAVLIDGGGHFTVFFRIMLPMAMPIMTTLFILSAIGTWNDYMGPMLYYPSFPGVATGLQLVSYEMLRKTKTIYYAALVLTTLPVLILFVFFSDKIMKNYTIGGLKG